MMRTIDNNFRHNEDNIPSRIKIFIDNQGISIRAFENKIRCSNGVINNAIRKKTDIQAKWITKIVENYPQIDLVWLLTGEGEMLKNLDENSSGNEILSLYKELKDAQKKIIELQEENADLKLENERLKSAFTSDATVPYAGSGCKTG